MKLLKPRPEEKLIFLPGCPAGFAPKGVQVIRFASQDLTDPLRWKFRDPEKERLKMTVIDGGGDVA